MAAKRSYLGQGIKYPHEVDVFGRIALISDKALVKQSLYVIFNTPIRSEFFREHEGWEGRELMFEQNSIVLCGLLDFYVVDAIAKWERRIKILDVKYTLPSDKPELIKITVNYRIRQSSEVDSFIFPFYRELKN